MSRRSQAGGYVLAGALLGATSGLGACAAHQAPPPSPVVAVAPGALPPRTVYAPTPPPPRAPVAPVAPAPPDRKTPDAPFRANAPAPGPEPQFKVPAYRRFKLKNGLEVMLSEFHELPLVDVSLFIRSGGGDNPPELAGLAEMTANMLDEGTKSRSAIQIADEIAQLGAGLGTSGSWDASSAVLSTLTKNLDAALAIWADVILHPAFAEQEFTRVRDNLLTAIVRRKDSPPVTSALALGRVLYGDKHPFGWPMTGVEASLKKLTLADLRKFYDNHYRPNNAVVIVAGDITEKELKAKLETALKGWQARGVPRRKLAAPPVPSKTKIYLIDKADAPQSSIRVGLVGIERTNPDYIPVTVMNLILGGGFYRLDLNLREGKGWTYGARSTFDSRRSPGPFSAGGEFVATHTADSVAEILKEVNAIRDTEVTDAELSRAKDQIIKSFPARFATRASTAGQLADLAIYGLPDKYLIEYTRKVAAVSKQDVHRVARKYLVPERLAVVVVGDEKSNRDALAKLAPVELRDLEGNALPAAPVANDAASAKKGTGASKTED
ncbi:MAG TPA: pitrilysin family protein [Polyangia bacterium]|nr:pitrilysin family protein [Polyangia bacterium]